MKSYQNHLKSTKSYGEIQDIHYRPTMRSSAAFPLIHKPGKVSSIFTFMGYWLRKRTIPLVTVLVTVRTADGDKIFVKSVEVSTVKSYVISSFDIFEDSEKEFVGSIELEIFSAVDMVFPYPAITFGLRGINGLTFVHTCGRIYNDFHDLKSNNEQLVAETGFDLYRGKNYTSFFSFVNGPIAIENKEIVLEFVNTNGAKTIKQKSILDVKPYGLGWVELDCENGISTRDAFSKTCVKVRHDFEGFFPRFVAGNILRDYEDISLTHSYYDTSGDKSQNALWKNPSKDRFWDSVVGIPFDTDFSEIELAIYPNLARAPVDLTFELYKPTGELVAVKETFSKIANGDDQLLYINLFDVFSEHNTSLCKGLVKLLCDGKGVTPSRMKFGLNFGDNAQETYLPSNICFNAQVPNKKILNKPNAFHWCTVFDAQHQKVFLYNTSFIKEGFHDAVIDIEIYRQRDDEKLLWSVNISYNGIVEILEPKMGLLKEFLGDEIGWLTASCSSPFITGYYITNFNQGVIGADHVY